MQPQPPNPYEAPNAPDAPRGMTPEGWVPCPTCGSTSVSMPSFTWWGGMIGAKMLTHVVCNSCHTGYNGKTGASNTTGIIIYSVVIGVIALVVVFGLQSI